VNTKTSFSPKGVLYLRRKDENDIGIWRGNCDAFIYRAQGKKLNHGKRAREGQLKRPAFRKVPIIRERISGPKKGLDFRR